MARAKRTVKESTAVQPVVEPTPEVAAATAGAAVASGQAHSNRPQDQVVGTTEPMDPAAKSAAISTIIQNALSGDDQVINATLAAQAQVAPETSPAKPEDQNEVVPDEAVAANQMSVAMKPSDASVKMVEAIEVMFAGEDLSSTFKNKAGAIFEALVNERVGEIEDELTRELSEDFEAQFQIEKQQLEEAVDKYLTNAAVTYLNENALAVENGIKSDLYESMVTDIATVVKSYNIALDDDQIELVTEAYNEVDDLKETANKLAETTQAQTQYIAELQRQLVFESVASDLTAIQRGALATLAESVEADELEVMTDKMVALKEHLLHKHDAVLQQTAQKFVLTEEIAEKSEEPKYTHENMKQYVNAVSTQVKKS